MSEDRIDELYHHGTKGMKWGIWNDETRARYLRLKTALSNRISKTASSIGRAASVKMEKHKENKARVAAEREAEKNRQKQLKIEQKKFDAETRRKYHLSGVQYKRLRQTTLDSNDPTVVRKGMHLLSDKELEEKIHRLNRENEIRKLASSKETADATVKSKKLEARQKTIHYQLAKAAGDAAIQSVKNNLIDPSLRVSGERAKQAFERSLKQLDKQEKEQEAKKKEKQREQEAKKNEKQRENEIKKQIKAEEKAEKKAEQKEQAEIRNRERQEQNRRKQEEELRTRREEAAKQTENVKQIIERNEIEAGEREAREAAERREERRETVKYYAGKQDPNHYRDEEWYKIARKRLS